MSVADLKAFGKKCAEDKNLQQKAKAIGMSNVDGIIKLGKENGFNFSVADMEDLAKEVAKTNKDALDEKQLEAIAGGAVTTTGAVSLALAAASLAIAVVQTVKKDW